MAGLVCVPGLLEHAREFGASLSGWRDGGGAHGGGVQGPMREVLVLERGLLNLVSRLGVATIREVRAGNQGNAGVRV